MGPCLPGDPAPPSDPQPARLPPGSQGPPPHPPTKPLRHAGPSLRAHAPAAASRHSQGHAVLDRFRQHPLRARAARTSFSTVSFSLRYELRRALRDLHSWINSSSSSNSSRVYLSLSRMESTGEAAQGVEESATRAGSAPQQGGGPAGAATAAAGPGDSPRPLLPSQASPAPALSPLTCTAVRNLVSPTVVWVAPASS